MVSFWRYFGVRWGLLATLGLPRAPLRGPSRKSDENVGSLTAFWPPLGVPLGSNFRYFLYFFGIFSVYVFESIFLRLLGSLGTSSNHENDGFVYTKPSFSHFHLELQNDRKWCPKGTLLDAFGWVLGGLGGHLGG